MGSGQSLAMGALLCGLLFVADRSVAAASEQPRDTAAQGDKEVQGVVINETRSVAGQAFYAGFFTVWSARDQEGIYSLLISEKPFPQNPGASRILVTYDSSVVLNQVINFNAGKARSAGEAATEYVFNRILEIEMGREFGNPDMAASGY